jgi:putative inorganic carbon (HCO3(-)) transporter
VSDNTIAVLPVRKNLAWFYSLGIVFIALCIGSLWYLEFEIGFILPVVFGLLLVGIFRTDILIMIITFMVPLSISIKDIGEGTGFGMNFPSEPITFVLMVGAWLKFMIDGQYDRRILKHPLTKVILFYLGWILFTAIFSTRFEVSIKFFINKLWIITVFYFLTAQLFSDRKNIRRFLWCYMVPMMGVIIYTLINHSEFGFTQKNAYWVSKPFYLDHGVYAASMAFFVPVLAGFLAYSGTFRFNNLMRFIIILFLGILITGIIYSFTRATWVSLAAAFIFFIALMLRLKFRTLLIIGSVSAFIYLNYKEEISMVLRSNKQDSANNFGAHVKSIYNVSTDDSNLERINRWHAALRMWREKPILGWGPGVYKFEYAPYQVSFEKTKISTNFGIGGNSHSEYVGPLCETGVIGFASFILVILMFTYKGMQLFYTAKDKQNKILTVMLLLGLVTYFVHGFLNNYSDSDKVGVMIWGFMAGLVALELREKEMSDKAVSTVAAS